MNSNNLRNDPADKFYKPSQIYNNKFKIDDSNGRFIGLRNVSTQNLSYFRIQNNTVRGVNNVSPCTHQSCCFHIGGCNRISLISNDLLFDGFGLDDSAIGIHHVSGGSNIGIQSNTIISSSPNFRKGIELDGVSDDFVCNNSIENTSHSILISSPCPGVYIGSNKLISGGSFAGFNSGTPIGIGINGTIPTQRHTGNQWVGTHFHHEAFIAPALNLSDQRFNRFLSNIDNYGTNIKYWPTLVNRVGLFRHDISQNLPTPCGATLINEEFNGYLADTSYRTSLTSGELWDNDLYFLNYYTANPDSLVHEDQIELFDSLNSSFFRNFYEIELYLDQFYNIDTNIVNSLGTLQIASDSFVMELNSIFDNLMQGDSVIFFNDSEVVNLIDTLSIIYSNINTIIDNIDTIRYENMDSLNMNINALQVSSEYDSLYKELFLIKLKLIESDTVSTDDYNFIYELAMECPKDLGTIVHKANSLLNWEDHLENLNLNCSSSIVLGGSEFNKNHTISVFPNPMTSEMSILSDYPIKECYMTDILGNIIPIDIEIDPKIRRSMEVKLNNVGIPSGSYILSIIFNDKTTTYKLVIKN